MGGESSSTQTQQSQTAPWAAAQPMLQNILGQVSTGLNNTGLTGAETNAINSLEANSQNMNQYVPAIQNYATSLLGGGGAQDQAGNVNKYYQQYYDATNPLASNTNYNPYDTPGFKDAINTLTSDVTNSVNGQFAAAGRDFSGANSQALARGITQGVAPAIQQQYNQNVQNQQSAAQNLLNAGNTNAGMLSGFQQQYLQNQGQGISAAQSAVDAQNYGANATLAAESQRRNIPVQNLSMLANIGTPIAGLGSQSTSTTTGTQQMSGAQQFGSLANSIGSLLRYIPSDVRLKEDIAAVGTLFDGTPVYRYRYKGAPAYHIGLLAQDVEMSTPAAVIEISGYKAVDYRAATEASLEIAEVG